jgi:hypothetical protein
MGIRGVWAMCGQAEFYSSVNSDTPLEFVVNTLVGLPDGVVNVTAFNPNHNELSWVRNTRIDVIDLLYRKSGSSKWLQAKDVHGNPAAFYDDVSFVMTPTRVILMFNQGLCLSSLLQVFLRPAGTSLRLQTACTSLLFTWAVRKASHLFHQLPQPTLQLPSFCWTAVHLSSTHNMPVLLAHITPAMTSPWPSTSRLSAQRLVCWVR